MKTQNKSLLLRGYDGLLAELSALIDQARRASARTVNAIMTATYWQIGRRIVEVDQGGMGKAEYGDVLLVRLAQDLSARFGRGYAKSNLYQMRAFYLAFAGIFQTVSGKSRTTHLLLAGGNKGQALSGESALREIAARFPLPWSAYVRLLSVKNEFARRFYEAEALRGGWSVRQLERQIESQFYERAALSKNKVAMLTKGAVARPEDAVTAEEEIRSPYVLEFLNLKDEYSESDLEEALIRHLEHFLMELGGDFAFVGRQKRLRIDDEWYRVDLLFFHRRLRCLVVIDLKRDRLSYADAGQMHMYLNYAREHWVRPGENPPVGLILCTHKGEAMARYALEGLSSKVLAAEYRTALPEVTLLAKELTNTARRLTEGRILRKRTS
ncbi:MAG: PDDEXK nuclease domain-containing protein [bacterium]